MAKGKTSSGAQRKTITVNLPNEAGIRELKTVLSFEASKRGMSASQAFVDLVMKAANTDTYPDEVRARLDEIRQARVRRATERSLAALDFEKSA